MKDVSNEEAQNFVKQHNLCGLYETNKDQINLNADVNNISFF